MGKLNYTNRKCEGEKLGEVVAKDLAKRVPPGVGSKSALRDPVVELDVSGKALTNLGFSKLYDALVRSIDYGGDQGKVVRLEELCLRDSRLGTLSLPLIAHIVSLAATDLRDLDLSENQFVINNDEDAEAWEGFLISLTDCCVLRRLDISGNKLGPRAFEILIRVYAKEKPIGLGSLYKDVIESTVRDDDKLEMRARKMSISSHINSNGSYLDTDSPVVFNNIDSMQHESKSAENTNSATNLSETPAIYTSTSGLRSVPYLIFSATSMTETCALHLSYVVAHHCLPEQLLPYVPAAKAGFPAQQLLTYDNISNCRGVIYNLNSDLGPAGMKVLDLAEAVREGRSSQEDEEPDEGVVEVGPSQLKIGANTRRVSDTRSISNIANRRRTSSSVVGIDQGGHSSKICANIELDRARSRIQGNTLQVAGASSNELWRAALKMLTLGRDIRPIIKKEPSPNRMSRTRDTKRVNSTSKSSRPSSLQMTPLSPRNPNQAINPNFGQWRLENSKLVPVTTPEPFLKKPSRPVSPPLAKPQKSPYRSQLPCGFPEDVWRRIIAFSTGAQAIMSETQQRSMLRWAMDRETLIKEKESLGLKESAQIWKVLEATGCLSYVINI